MFYKSLYNNYVKTNNDLITLILVILHLVVSFCVLVQLRCIQTHTNSKSLVNIILKYFEQYHQQQSQNKLSTERLFRNINI